MARIMVTGCAGFIGYHVSRALLARGDEVAGCDNLCPHYDVTLKRARLDQLLEMPGFAFQQLEMADREAVLAYFAKERVEAVIHLAALAGVRYAMQCPELYVQSNLVAFGHVLDALVQRAEGDEPRIARGVQRHEHFGHLGERGGEVQRIGQQVGGGDGEKVGTRLLAGPAGLHRGHDHGGQQPGELAQR
jgi:nucleoside-diphosphate-sugar epimerase